MPDEDLGRIWVGQLPGSGALYALPASYYEFDFPEGADPCPPKGTSKGDKHASPACERRSLPAAAWDANGRCGHNNRALAAARATDTFTVYMDPSKAQRLDAVPVSLSRVLASNASGSGPGVPLGVHEVIQPVHQPLQQSCSTCVLRCTAYRARVGTACCQSCTLLQTDMVFPRGACR
jgi:hypothetical protein